MTRYNTHCSGCGNIARIFSSVFLFALAFLVCCMTSDLSYAFNEADLARLLSTKQCQWCNLRDADLAGAQLSGAQLSNASLTSAQLSNANLSRTNLSGAFLMKANLTGAKLIDAFLANANLTNANVTDADFSGADLSGAIWTDGTKCEKKSFGECKQSNLLGEPK